MTKIHVADSGVTSRQGLLQCKPAPPLPSKSPPKAVKKAANWSATTGPSFSLETKASCTTCHWTGWFGSRASISSRNTTSAVFFGGHAAFGSLCP